MIRGLINRGAGIQLQVSRGYVTVNPGFSSGDVKLEERPSRKIKVGKARPAVYHKFEVKVKLSDGSVITRRTQYPKLEVQMINDQRNNPLWNPSRKDLSQVNTTGADRVRKFKERYSLFNEQSEEELQDADEKPEAKISEKQAEAEDEAFGIDDYLSVVGENAQEVQAGGRLQHKKKSKK